MRAAKRSVIILINQAIEQALPLIMAVILTRLIDKELFGRYRQVTMVYLFLSAILCLNIPPSMYYFLPISPPEKKRSIIAQSILMLLFMAFITTLIMWFGAGFLADNIAKDASLVEPIKAYSFVAVGGLISLVVGPSLISQKRVILSGIYQIGFALIRVITVVTIFLLGWSLTKVMYGTVVVSLLGAAAGVMILWFTTSGSTISINLQSIKEQLGYIGPLAAAGMTGVLATYLDKWVIMFFFNSGQYAEYSVGAVQIPVVSLITTSITNAIMPDIVKMSSESRNKDAMNLWHNGIRKCALIIFPAYVLCVCTSHDIIILCYSKAYINAIGPFVVYLTLLPIQIAIYGTMLRATGFTKPIFSAAVWGLVLNTLVSVAGVMAFKGSYFAFIAPAMGIVVATVVIAAYQLMCVAKITCIPFSAVFPWKDTAKLFLLATVCGGAIVPVQFIGGYLVFRIIVSFVVYSIVFIGALFLFNVLTMDEKKLLMDAFVFIKNKTLKTR